MRVGKVWFLVSCSLTLLVRGNTEIVNFAADGASITPSELNELVLPTKNWPNLDDRQSEIRWAILPAPLGTSLESVCISDVDAPFFSGEQSDDLDDAEEAGGCPHELWLRLDLTREAWASYSKFTLRLSWSASFSADFSIRIYDAQELHDHLARRHMLKRIFTSESRQPRYDSSRTKYARIWLVDTGVRVPLQTQTDSSSRSVLPAIDKVPFVIVLEPLYFGVLPASVVPVLAFIPPILAFAWLAVPRINAYLERLADDAVRELRSKGVSSPKKHE